MTTPTRLPSAAEILASGQDAGRAATDHLNAAEAMTGRLSASDQRKRDWHLAQTEALVAADRASIDYAQVIQGHGPDSPEQASHPQDGHRRAADLAMANLASDGLLQDGPRERLTKLMERGHVGQREQAARFIAATASRDYASAFAKYVLDPQNCAAAMTEDERRAYRTVQEVRAWTEGTPASVGWTVPLSLDATVLLSNAGVNSPIRKVARVELINAGDRWRGLTSAGTVAEWKPELTAVNPVTPLVSVPEVPVHFLSAFTRFSLEIQADGLRMVENLQQILADAANTKQETAFATGSGVAEPEGVVVGLAKVAASVVLPTTAETYTKFDPIKLQNDLAPRFQPNASFLASLKILNETAIFELSSGGSILYPDVRNGRMLNRNVYEMSTLDATYDATVTAANYCLAYGDWAKAFVIADRLGTGFEVIPHLLNAAGNPTGERGGWLHSRVGSGVIMPEAARLLNIATTAP